MQAHDLEVVAIHDAGFHFAGLAEADHGESNGGKVTEGAERLHAGFEINDFGDREPSVLDAEAHGALANVNKAVFVAIDEWSQKDSAHQAEDGGIGADTESEGQDNRQRQAFCTSERSRGNRQILKE